ncbi:MAG: SMC family ATPase, partial [Deltaproteobacteria bacterium]|nr:SMC family ATPase [Deltaproteobacteria bacterium]
QEREEKLQQLRSRYSALGDIAKKANGDNPLRLTFQRFVLAAFLDNVLELASVSLRKMSKGRYHLRRAEESQDKRSAGGLDLVVFDAQTGVERAVSTLSGGESFLASLALALGLAEVVQHYAGGIKLDAIFIDEGFGTLDADALDLAISTLLELRQGGRMVGVISHVTELRERIQTQLEIQTTRQGSTTQFHLP